MWIRAEDGKLHNMNFVFSIFIDERSDGHSVKALFNTSDMRAVYLTHPKDRKQAARDLDLIAFEVLNDHPLDLTAPQHHQGEVCDLAPTPDQFTK